jgi:hypothetical protein
MGDTVAFVAWGRAWLGRAGSALVVTTALAAAACDGPPPGPEPVLGVGAVPASELVPLTLPDWPPGEVAAPAEWPRACELVRQSDAIRIVPRTTHQTVQESELGSYFGNAAMARLP